VTLVSVLHLLLVVAATLAAAKLLALLARRIGQPAVLGELIAGVLLGGSVLGWLDPTDPAIHVLSEIGVIILLFEIGLHTELKAITKVLGAATTVAIVGVVLPMALGYAAVVSLLGMERTPALVCAAALTATSIGISARVLSDIGQLKSREGQVVLGAAVLDDIAGLIVLAIVTSVVTGNASGINGLASAVILGAFGVGMILNRTAALPRIEKFATSVGHFLVPIFFAAVGAAVKIGAFAETPTLAVAAILIIAGVAGKYLAAYAPWWFSGNKPLIGVAMIPRGEVGLIFAQMGLTTQAIDQSLFSALTLMVMVTTFLAPPLLARIGKRGSIQQPVRDEAGIDDLVAGEWSQPNSVERDSPTAS
jgi:Kef-type K+ transport system membrane component KefB